MTGKGRGTGPYRAAAQPGTVPASVDVDPEHQSAIRKADDRRYLRGQVPLSEPIRNRLAVQLREMYDTMVQQPVPDRFSELIAQLDKRESEKT